MLGRARTTAACYMARILPKRLLASFDLCRNLLVAHSHWMSFKHGPLDAKGQPLPWFTYPAISYLLSLDLRDKSVFEFGCGSSTLFWSRICQSVDSAEGNPAWHHYIRARVGSNTKLHFVAEKDSESYVEPLLARGKQFDIIVIDGWHRRHCAEVCLPFLADGGIIIHDNTEWYLETRAILLAYDLIQIDFFGFIPASTHTGVTSFYLKRNFSIKPALKPAWIPGSKVANHEGCF